MRKIVYGGVKVKYLLLDIESTLTPLNYKGVDAVIVDIMGFCISFPRYIADWLKEIEEKEIKIIWCTSKKPYECKAIEDKIGFKSEGYLQFFNQNAYHWTKLSSIIDFCNEHEDDLVVLADNDIKEGTRGIQDLPINLELVWPSDSCLSVEDLELIDRL